VHYNVFAAKGIIRLAIMSCSTRDHSITPTFAENGINREGGDGSAQCEQSVIYDCLVTFVVCDIMEVPGDSTVKFFLIVRKCIRDASTYSGCRVQDLR